ncbi:MAG: phage Gp37/Gp68 family protein [Deltaproteobacteria bacterium]|jgi:protein gp37|nr:phage Gp37/Gp68 family protein [Deltaproteobacteria bacterium]
MSGTKIEWTDLTWNPVTGCSKISSGCDNCYAQTLARRLQAMGSPKYAQGFTPTAHHDSLNEPLKWKRPRSIFVCSMADLFHEAIPFSFIDQVMATINSAKWHYFQILTKRAARMANYFAQNPAPAHVWLGVTVENGPAKRRIDFLREIDCSIKFISCEPLLEDLGFIDLKNINWVIVGGETGVNARVMKPEWARSIKRLTEKMAIPFFFKQWGAWGADGVKRTKKANGQVLDGQITQMTPKA